MIKNIIFDLGGVLLNLDYALTDEAFKELLGLNFSGRNYPKNYIHLFNNYEKGSLEEAGFFSSLNQLSGKSIDVSVLKEAWNRMLLDFPAERLPLLLDLRKSFTIILLSNTNATHLNQFRVNMEREHGLQDFDQQYFDHVFYSHQVGMRKPDYEIYVHVLDSCGIKASETVFIDDSAPNLEAPLRLGISCFLHPRNSDIVSSVNQYLSSIQ